MTAERNRLIVLTVSLLAMAGCAKLDLSKPLLLFETEPKPQTPDSVVAVWSNATLHRTGKPVVRGFGGRVLFHTAEDRDKPVLVEGNVAVYAFDDEHPDAEKPLPEKKYVFPAANLAKHQSESTLGPSYSFWLPWDNLGGRQRRISLVTRFEDLNGKVVMSDIAHVTLDGNISRRRPAATTGPPEPSGLPAGTADPVRRASYNSSPAAGTQPGAYAERRVSEVAIDMAPAQARRLLLPQPQKEDGPGSSFTRTQPFPRGLQAGTISPATTPVNSPAAETTATLREAAPPTDSPREQPPARISPTAQRAYDPAQRPLRRGEPLRRLPPTPRSGWSRSPTMIRDEEPVGN